MKLEGTKKSGSGGNVIFQTGSGGAGGMKISLGDCGHFIFNLGDGAQGPRREVIRITPEGFFVEGKKIADDAELYTAFKLWVKRAIAVSSEPREPQS